jgi:hypothetical protein
VGLRSGCRSPIATAYVNTELIQSIASALYRGAIGGSGIEKLAERRDMEPATLAEMRGRFAERPDKDIKVTIPGWGHVGRVDVVVRDAPRSMSMSALIELKWCGRGHDVVYEGISDMFKMALGTLREDHPRGYLITGAAKSLWTASEFADLFSSRDHDPIELCARRLSDRRATIAWDEAIRGAYEHYPEAVPSGITTRTRGRAVVGDWELRAVEVVVTNTKLISMEGGLAARTTAERRSPSRGCLSSNQFVAVALALGQSSRAPKRSSA